LTSRLRRVTVGRERRAHPHAVPPGEEVTVRLTLEGREQSQGIGFMEDGTMVVVEEAGEQIGADVRVTVTNILQTTSGRMVLACLGQG